MVKRTLGIRALVFALGLTMVGLAAEASAQIITFYGDERVGGTGGQFLRVPAGGRTVGMGSSDIATAIGPAAMFSNPAALSTLRSRHGFFVSHFEYAAEIDIDHIAYAFRSGSWQLGFGLGMLRSGEIERTTEYQPNGTGQFFNANQFLGSVTVSRLLTDRFTFAGSAKFLQENLDDFHTRSVMLDLGALYHTGFRSARIGFALRNFGPDIRINGTPPPDAGNVGTWQTFPAPTVAVFGAAYDLSAIGGRRMTVSMDFAHPSDEGESVVFAGEFELSSALLLRGAYRTDAEEAVFSGGLGVVLGSRREGLRLDYGFTDRDNFGVLHVVSLELMR